MTRFSPMQASGLRNFVDRGYRESASSQWVRETFINAKEAGATTVHFGVEWQAVEAKGVYRRTIADNGRGMTPGELRQFFNTFGGGGKPIGGEHENFGIGSKTSLLPWNTYGLVVVSYTAEYPDGSMIWLMQDPASGEYGLKAFEIYDGEGEAEFATVVTPFYDPDEGIDWSKIKPSFIERTGTVIVLLGNSPSDNTVRGDPSREEESDIRAVAKYLNRRLWDLGETKVYVHELRSTNPTNWPRSEEEAFSPRPADSIDRRVNLRQVRGTLAYIRYTSPSYARRGGLADEGTVELSDGTEVAWYLWSGERPEIHDYAPKWGFVGVLYRGELYDLANHPSRFRQFGISEKEVRERVWLVMKPKEYDPATRRGVYPRGDRSALALAGRPEAALPWDSWGLEFLEKLPDAIRGAIHAASGGNSSTIDDPDWRRRLADRFGSLWKIVRKKLSPEGKQSTEPTDSGARPRPHVPRPVPRERPTTPGGQGGLAGPKVYGTGEGPEPAVTTSVAGGLPYAVWKPAEEFEGSEWAIATWVPHHQDFPGGVVWLNREHPVVLRVVEHWVDQYPAAVADRVEEAVHEVFGELAIARVAHSAEMKRLMPDLDVEKELRSDGALTLGLLGMVDVWALLSDRLPSRVGRRSAAA